MRGFFASLIYLHLANAVGAALLFSILFLFGQTSDYDAEFIALLGCFGLLGVGEALIALYTMDTNRILNSTLPHAVGCITASAWLLLAFFIAFILSVFGTLVEYFWAYFAFATVFILINGWTGMLHGALCFAKIRQNIRDVFAAEEKNRAVPIS